ncbi:MAG: hypothetical protein ACKO2Z_14295 [Sphaerospermopsis kisseleviana]
MIIGRPNASPVQVSELSFISLSRSQSLTGNAILESLTLNLTEGRAFENSFPYRVWERENEK